MPIADSKKETTIRNLFHELVSGPVTEAASKAAVIRDAIVANDLQGEFAEAERTAVDDYVTALEALAASTVTAAMASRYVPSHDAKAGRLLTITGVND